MEVWKTDERSEQKRSIGATLRPVVCIWCAVRRMSKRKSVEGQPVFPRRLYRCFDQEEHARTLLEGRVWISTIAWLRETERARGDPLEATVKWIPGIIDSSDHSEETLQKMEKAREFGIDASPGSTVSLFPQGDNIIITHRPRNGYVLCMTATPPTQKIRNRFGHFCVCISDPTAFVHAVGASLLFADRYEAGFLDYSGRTYRGLERFPASTPFLGPPDNAEEAEYRIHWPPREGVIPTPHLVDVPGVANLCSMF